MMNVEPKSILGTQVGLYVPILVMLLLPNLFWFGVNEPRKGFPLPYLWLRDGQEHGQPLALMINGIASLGFAGVLSWGVPIVVSRRRLRIAPIDGRRIGFGGMLTALALTIFGPPVGVVMGAAWSLCLFGGVLNLAGILGAGISPADSLSGGAYCFALFSLPIGFIAAWLLILRKSDHI